MPALTIASPNQVASTSGRVPRLGLSEALRANVPQLYQDRAFAQSQRALDLESSQLDLENQRLALAEEAQSQAQTDQTAGTLIQGAGTLATGALAAKQLGLFGSAAAPAAAGAGTTAAATAGGTAATAAGAEAALTAGGVALDTGGAASGAAAGGALGGASAGLAAAGGGVAAGAVGGLVANQLPIPSYGQGLTGAAIGAAGGFLVGGPVGAIAGGLVGGLSGGLCILTEAAYGTNSPEMHLARDYRDRFLSPEQRRAYYFLYEPVATRMQRDPAYRDTMRVQFTDPLLRYGRWQMGQTPTVDPSDAAFARHFLAHLAQVGAGLRSFTRANGEVV